MPPEAQTAASITTAINETLATYIKQGETPYSIGNGLCEDFAFDVLKAVFGPQWMHAEGKSDWQTFCTEQFLTTNAAGLPCWDWGLLQHSWGINMPEASRSQFDAFAPLGPSHVWIHFQGRHYDCEHPEGVHSFLDLNFFKRWLVLANPTSKESPGHERHASILSDPTLKDSANRI